MAAAPPPFGYYDAPGATSSPPPVLLWYRVFCIACALLYVGFIVVFTLMPPGGHMRSQMGESTLMLLIGLPFTLFYGFAAFVPRRPWGWVFGLVAIAFAMMSCTALFAVPILVFWLKPVTQAAFGRFSPR